MDFLVVYLQEMVELKANKDTAIEMVQQAGHSVINSKIDPQEEEKEIGLNGEPKKSLKKYRKSKAVLLLFCSNFFSF